jgi:hypothetical protein
MHMRMPRPPPRWDGGRRTDPYGLVVESVKVSVFE